MFLLQADRWYYIDDGPLFETLPHLIDHYRKHMDGLPVLLMEPVPSSHDVRAAAPVPPKPTLPSFPMPGNFPPITGRPKPPPRPSGKSVSFARHFPRLSSPLQSKLHHYVSILYFDDDLAKVLLLDLQ